VSIEWSRQREWVVRGESGVGLMDSLVKKTGK